MYLPVSETATSTSVGSCELVTGHNMARLSSGSKTPVRQCSHPNSSLQVEPECNANLQEHKSKPLQSRWSLPRRSRLHYSICLTTALSLLMPSFFPFANAAFLQVPTPLNVTVGAVAEFFCRADADAVFWTVNNESVIQLGDPNISPDNGPVVDGLLTQVLRIMADVQYNNSVIQCSSFSVGEGPASSGPALLLVQGLLAAVGDPRINLVNGTLCLSWTPPFTLNITDVDPDLYYIIEITSTADAENPLTVSCNDCSSEYKFTVNNSSPCDSFTFTVVPVNGAGNGTPSDPLQGSFTQAPPELISITVTNVTVTVLQDDQLVIEAPYPSNSECQFQLAFTSSDSLEPAFSCQIQLSADLDNELGDLTLIVQNGSSCQPFTLPMNRVFDMRIEAQNIAGSTTLAEEIRLSTHDAQDAVVTVSPMPGTVTVSVTYAVNTSAVGHLAILVNSSVMAVAFTARDRSSQATTIRGLLADEYTALVFDIESNGLPSTAAADSEAVDVTEGADESLQTDPNLSAEVEVDPDLGVCTTCSFETSNSVGCVVIMHSAMPQLVVHSISREGATESSVQECFTVPFGSYTVAVFNRESSNMIALDPATVSYVTITAPPTTPTGSPSAGGLPISAVIGIAIGAVIAIIIILLLICGIVYCRVNSPPRKGDHAKLLQFSIRSTGSSIRATSRQEDVRPFIGGVVPDGGAVLETPLSAPEEPTATNVNPASTFGHGDFGYATVGPATSPGLDKTKTITYTQLDLPPTENPPPQVDPVPYQTVQVQPETKTNYAQLNLPPNEDPPPPDDTVTYQTIQPKPGATAGPSQPPKPTLPALDINDLDVLLIMVRPIQFMWYQLGAELGVHDDLLKQIAEFSSESSVCSTEMLSQWLQYQPESSPPTWEDITRAIQQLGEDSDNAKKVAEQFQHVITTGMRPAVQHSPLPLPANETPPPLPPRSDSHSLPTTDEQLQSTPSPLPPPVEDPPPTPPSPRQSPSSPHLLIRQPSYSSTDTSEEAPSSPIEEPLSLPSPRRAPPPPPTSMGVPSSSYSHSPVLREEPPVQPMWRRSPPPPPIGELPPYSPPSGPSSHQPLPPYTPPLTPLLSSPPIEFHGTMV